MIKSGKFILTIINLLIISGIIATVLISCEKNKDEDPPQDNHQNGDPDPNEFDNECNFVDFYYYDNEQVFMGEMSGDYILFGSNINNPDNELEEFINALEYFDTEFDYILMYGMTCSHKRILVKLYETKDCVGVTEIMYELRKFSIVDYIHYTIETDDCEDAFSYSHEDDICVATHTNIFSVQVIDTLDLTDLQNMMIETNTVLIGQNQFMRDWFVLMSDKSSKGNALQMANYFYESEKFLECRPEIIKYVVE